VGAIKIISWLTTGLRSFAEWAIKHSAYLTRRNFGRQRGLSAKPLPSAKKHLAKMNTRQRMNQKTPQKIAKKNLPGEAPPASVRPSPSKSQSHGIFHAKFARYAAGRIRTYDLSLARLYHYTTLSLVSRFHFGSPHIILNRV
jgi:hypothetical protein